MNPAQLYRQLGGNHWKNGIIEHLKQQFPRERTIVCSYFNGWNYVIEDTPNNPQSLQLKTYHINYNNNNLHFESDNFIYQLNEYIDTNPLSVINVRTATRPFNNL